MKYRLIPFLFLIIFVIGCNGGGGGGASSSRSGGGGSTPASIGGGEAQEAQEEDTELAALPGDVQNVVLEIGLGEAQLEEGSDGISEEDLPQGLQDIGG